MANFITEGASIRGAISTNGDRDIFQFTASSTKTRVIVRKPLKPFTVAVDVYDSAEDLIITDHYGHYDRTISFSFKSTPDSIYYIVVKQHRNYPDELGDYELIVRKD